MVGQLSLMRNRPSECPMTRLLGLTVKKAGGPLRFFSSIGNGPPCWRPKPRPAHVRGRDGEPPGSPSRVRAHAFSVPRTGPLISEKLVSFAENRRHLCLRTPTDEKGRLPPSEMAVEPRTLESTELDSWTGQPIRVAVARPMSSCPRTVSETTRKVFSDLDPSAVRGIASQP